MMIIVTAVDGEVRIAMDDTTNAWLTPEQAFNLAIEIVETAKIAKKQRMMSAQPLAAGNGASVDEFEGTLRRREAGP